ncbi:SseB family protein [Nocardioides bruguierae]|uniref:SseB family protein n=1 Tax=Nocardioides bruguierae TaxID=2945102 RepID=A0A9X2DB67_9ACTN|nr:SseB family protein [Nocardioides bruguierae]MCL8027518.1 SseB family protein [Nocardioides bruguierae]MCM0622157.1 SseB family protein [Nocardioides bruguierae]
MSRPYEPTTGPDGKRRWSFDVTGDGRSLEAPAFPDDDGTADAGLAAALAARTAARGDRAAAGQAYLACLDALTRARLLVPVVAVLGEVGLAENGLAVEKDSDMAAVLLTGADGRTALLSFSATATMAAWDPEARPVAVPARTAAEAAIAEGASALVLDLAGPHRLVVEGDDLSALASGWTLARVGEGQGATVGWVRPT